VKIIDSHCHLDDFFYDGTIDEILSNAAVASVDKMVAVGTHLRDWQFYCKFVGKHQNIFYTVGLHPTNSEMAEEIDALPGFLEMENKPIAIGEIGLDYHRLPKEPEAKAPAIERQKNAFAAQLKFAKASNLPVVIHSRQAFDDTFEMLTQSAIPGENVLFHCYGYGVCEMGKIKEFGAFTSFSGTITYKPDMAEPLKAANLNRLLIETDCPYLTPNPHKPKRNEPAFLRATAECAAKILNMRDGDFCDLVRKNTEKFFGIG
jgi:TatD DNase family protein